MPKADILTKKGTKIHIEGDIDDIKEIVTSIKRREDFEERFYLSRILRQNESAHHQSGSITDVLLKFKSEGFFNEGKTLGEISKELLNRGFHTPRTTLSALLLFLVRRGELKREQEDEQWRYKQP